MYIYIRIYIYIYTNIHILIGVYVVNRRQGLHGRSEARSTIASVLAAERASAPRDPPGCFRI